MFLSGKFIGSFGAG